MRIKLLLTLLKHCQACFSKSENAGIGEIGEMSKSTSVGSQKSYSLISLILYAYMAYKHML